MVTYKRKKVHRYRGHSNHGGGMRKKRRGAGSRGGRGNAGTGKRAGHKKAGLGLVLGSHGFLPRRENKSTKTVNVGWFTSARVEKLLQAGTATKESGYIVIDLEKLGYVKLLGAGKTDIKLKLQIRKCSSSATEKVKAVGGEVISSEGSEE